ncbi:hypothetical protein EHW99_0772 [Erwinia amylovora]|uniref:Uncharacterized protein n=2 Tax=Erwinia amylovora TaxID=552 RepID=A0A831A3Y9_ERWAM|nr:hypothetical protein EaACW_2851 [Erwinia amylovora ACW56400]QJQ53479.1 hypothetical protein EHX00_0772 [Erwinia amylovora]CBA22482.1 hypothetical protein predicted by Glimmer/Critica [Erwinia amylovora CFBP1430]CCO79695.1 hypothetical protein BN432_2916 [Erwinia amylovora Ea356]CCO83498.1 hypothetical protein BN433_2941 [Erwinia amylovora Ea266]CCO87257.1 hypothetical protein BN434_2887 [Erwinia amylovora CFBP 2585]CCO91053.1 hypothetical protein BN435_2901 [Erwinia amylovora 01SFR-BO]CCO
MVSHDHLNNANNYSLGTRYLPVVFTQFRFI